MLIRFNGISVVEKLAQNKRSNRRKALITKANALFSTSNRGVLRASVRATKNRQIRSVSFR